MLDARDIALVFVSSFIGGAVSRFMGWIRVRRANKRGEKMSQGDTAIAELVKHEMVRAPGRRMVICLSDQTFVVAVDSVGPGAYTKLTVLGPAEMTVEALEDVELRQRLAAKAAAAKALVSTGA